MERTGSRRGWRKRILIILGRRGRNMLGQGHAEPESPRPKSPKRDYTLQESL